MNIKTKINLDKYAPVPFRSALHNYVADAECNSGEEGMDGDTLMQKMLNRFCWLNEDKLVRGMGAMEDAGFIKMEFDAKYPHGMWVWSGTSAHI